MTGYSKEVIRDLVSGTLPWHQTKRIMSAYKDEDRFFKFIEVLQERVPWRERILLPIGDHLFIVEPSAVAESRFIQRERFTGALVPFVRRSLDRGTLPAFQAMNAAIKDRAEKAIAAGV